MRHGDADRSLDSVEQQSIADPGLDTGVNGNTVLGPDQVREALRLMLQSRAIDEFAIKLQRLKRIGLYAPVFG